jgi:hypothetical protein
MWPAERLCIITFLFHLLTHTLLVHVFFWAVRSRCQLQPHTTYLLHNFYTPVLLACTLQNTAFAFRNRTDRSGSFVQDRQKKDASTVLEPAAHNVGVGRARRAQKGTSLLNEAAASFMTARTCSDSIPGLRNNFLVQLCDRALHEKLVVVYSPPLRNS